MKHQKIFQYCLAVIVFTSASFVFAGVRGDVNGDWKLGLDDTVYTLQVVAGLKPPHTTALTINGVNFDVDYDVFTWDTLPSDVIYERETVQSYTNSDGVTHYYEAVCVTSGNLNWYQAAYLAQDAGGYLACPTDADENTFTDLVIKILDYVPR